MNEEKDIQEELVAEDEIVASEPGKYDALMAEQSTKRLTGMYKNWFLDYASYVILERGECVVVQASSHLRCGALHAPK